MRVRWWRRLCFPHKKRLRYQRLQRRWCLLQQVKYLTNENAAKSFEELQDTAVHSPGKRTMISHVEQWEVSAAFFDKEVFVNAVMNNHDCHKTCDRLLFRVTEFLPLSRKKRTLMFELVSATSAGRPASMISTQQNPIANATVPVPWELSTTGACHYGPQCCTDWAWSLFDKELIEHPYQYLDDSL